MLRTLRLIALLLAAILPVALVACTGKPPQGTKIGQMDSGPSGSVPSVSESPAQPGKHVPDVTLTGLDGKKVRLEQLMDPEQQALPTLLMFATTDCSYCAEEFVELQSVQDKFKDHLRMLTVLVNETPDSAREFLKNTKVPGTVLVDPEAEAAITYNIGLVPTLLLTDSNGYVNYIGNFTPEEDVTELVTRVQNGERLQLILPGRG